MKIKKKKIKSSTGGLKRELSPRDKRASLKALPGISATQLQRFQTCRKSSEFWRQGWIPNKPALPLVWGSIWHSLLQKMTVYAMNEGIEVLTEKFIQLTLDDEFIKIQQDKWMSKDKEFIDKLEEQIGVMAELAKAYVKYYKDDFNGKRKWIETEKMHEIEYAGNRIVSVLDGAYKDKIDKHWVFETKTKSRIADNGVMVDFLAMDLQTHLYCLVYEKRYNVFPAGIVYNTVRKPEARRNKTETLQSFWKRVGNDIAKRPTFYFIRTPVAVSKKQEEVWRKENLEPLIQDYRLWLDGKISCYRNTNACEGKYGACQFLPICASGETKGFHKKEKDRYVITENAAKVL